MNRVKFSYEMELSFETPIHDHYFTLRCFPRKTVRQEILSMQTEVSPYDTLGESVDGFGNTTYIGHKKGEHDSFSVSLSGLAAVDWSRYETDDNLLMCFRQQSAYTHPSKEMQEVYAAYAASCSGRKSYAAAEFLMHAVHRHFTYQKQVTDIHTTAADAFALGTGVCQDYAHVMLSFARMAHLPARYVVGLMIGEGESHAWVEVYCKDRWYGFDPTNDALIGNEYIIISKGRDYRDCIMNQGKFYGSGKQTQKIKAKVEIIDDRDDSKGGTSGWRDAGDSQEPADRKGKG